MARSPGEPVLKNTWREKLTFDLINNKLRLYATKLDIIELGCAFIADRNSSCGHVSRLIEKRKVLAGSPWAFCTRVPMRAHKPKILYIK
jgi:hypothetical protein